MATDRVSDLTLSDLVAGRNFHKVDAPAAPTPTPAAPNPYLDLLSGEAARANVQTTTTLQSTANTDGDAYATQKRVAGFLGYPVAAVEASPDAAQREAAIKKARQDIDPHPLLRAKYGDEDFAKLAHDDSSSLAQLSTAIESTAKYAFGSVKGTNGLATDLASGVAMASRGFAGVFQAALEFGAKGAEVLVPALGTAERLGIGGGNPLQRLAEGFAIAGADAGATAKRISPPASGIVFGGVQSGVQSLSQQLLTLPLAMVNPTLALITMAAPQGGPSHMEARS